MKSNFNFQRKFIASGNICVYLNDCATKRQLTTPMTVFIHGMWGSARIFEFWLRYADAMNIPAVAFDLRGHGSSRCTNGGLGHASILDYVADGNEVVDTFGKCYLVGHSMGALIARKVATENSNVLKVVSVTSAPEAGLDMMLAPSVMLKMMAPRYLSAMLFKKEFTLTAEDAEELMGNTLSGEDLEHMLRETNLESGRAARDITMQVHVDKLRIESLVIGAGCDNITRIGIQERIARRHGSEISYTNSGHMIPLDTQVNESVFMRITKFLGNSHN